MNHASPLYGAEFEHELLRDPALGFEAVPASVVACLAHGTPSRQERWHYHDEYELHLVVETHGKAYIGDEIVAFEPGFLVLIGPRVPHNLVSLDVPAGGIGVRSMAIQFREEPLRKAMELFPELHEAVPLLARARYGVEFVGAGEGMRARFEHIRSRIGLARFAEFALLLGHLARWPACRLLSAVHSHPARDDERRNALARKIDKALDHIHENYAGHLSLPSVSAVAGMGEQAFSRCFRRFTGSTYTEFVTRVRTARACQLLRQTDHQVTSICFLVGFNNISNFNRQFRRLRGMTPGEYRSDKAFRKA